MAILWHINWRESSPAKTFAIKTSSNCGKRQLVDVASGHTYYIAIGQERRTRLIWNEQDEWARARATKWRSLIETTMSTWRFWEAAVGQIANTLPARGSHDSPQTILHPFLVGTVLYKHSLRLWTVYRRVLGFRPSYRTVVEFLYNCNTRVRYTKFIRIIIVTRVRDRFQWRTALNMTPALKISKATPSSVIC